MGSVLDHSVGFGAEITYGTPVAPTRWLEWLPGDGLRYDPRIVQGAGLRVGSKMARSTRRASVFGQGSGQVKAELLTKGFGIPLQACFGTGASTLVAGTTFQQLFTPTQTAAVLPAVTVQEGIARNDGTIDPYTWAGCTVASFEIDCPTGEIVTLSMTLDARTVATATALTAPVMPTSANLYHWALATAKLGGVLTAPTTTTLASSAGSLSTLFKSFNLTIDNNIAMDRWVISPGRNQPIPGVRSGKLKATIEYNDASVRDLLVSQAASTLLLELTTTEALSTGFATMQLAFSDMRLNSPEAFPVPTNGEPVTCDVEWEVMDNTVATQPVYMALRTADNAL